MIYVENNVVNLTRGDDAVLTVPMVTQDGETYTIGEREYLIFTVRKIPSEDSPILLEIQSTPGQNIIYFRHSDTVDLDCGQYSAEIQLMATGNQRYTVWPKVNGAARYTPTTNRKNFVLMTEVVRV